MAVNLTAPDVLHPVLGVRLGVAEAAIKRPGRNDLVLIDLIAGTQIAGVFTQNGFAAAPVLVCRQHLAVTPAMGIRALVINSGNANAATGHAGILDAQAICTEVGRLLGCHPSQVLPFSTGVIGQRLPLERMVSALPAAVGVLESQAWQHAMAAIMTTDTVPKGATRKIETSQGLITVTGIAKGVGMIHPDMATMLAFIGTDAKLSANSLRGLLNRAAHQSFNSVTVDGDTSTNDSCVLFATGQSGASLLEESGQDFELVAKAIDEVSRDLAHAIVRDGEGATKFIEIQVDGARSVAEARQVAFAVAHSPLVKTAMFASDANWGRIAMAIGKSGIPDFDPQKVDIFLGDIPVLSGGQLHLGYADTMGAAIVSRSEFSIRISLGRGQSSTSVWTCDFSYDYVRINAEYRT